MYLLKVISKLINIIRLLSFDIISGALAGIYYFSNLFGVKSPLFWYITMAVSVWIIYTIDHILDSIKNKRPTFHYQNKIKLLIITLLLSIINLFIIYYYYPSKLIISSLIPCVLLVFYMLLIHYFRYKAIKELLISIIYTLAIAYFPLYKTDFKMEHHQYLSFASYFLLVLTNVFTFSYYNSTRIIQKRRRKSYVLISTILVLGINIFGIVTQAYSIQYFICQIIMALVIYSCIFLNSSNFIRENYGIIADLVFSIPLLFFH